MATIKIKSMLFFSAFCLFNAPASGEGESQTEEVTVSRYVTVSLSAQQEQRQPLTNVINLNLDRNATTVLDAIDAALKDSGYRLATYHPDRRVVQMFALPLPAVHRTLGPISVAGALKTITGKPWSLVVDPINRLVTFQLPDTYKDAPLVYVKPKPAPKPVVQTKIVYVPIAPPVPVFDQKKTLRKLKNREPLVVEDIPEALR